MHIIDCHSHYEPEILDSAGILQRMDNYKINMIALMSKITENPLYKKSNFLMSIQRNIISNKYSRPLAKILDESFHRKKGEWNPWYRKFIKSKKSYKILIKPDNDSVFKLVNQYPKKFSITKIIQNPESNMAMNLDFEASSGMSREEAVEMNTKCINMAEEKFPSIQIWGTLPREHFLLYLDRYGKEGLSGNKPLERKENELLCKA